MKKTIALLLVLILSMGLLAGCGEKTQAPTDNTEQTSSNTEPAESAKEENKQFKIGGNGDEVIVDIPKGWEKVSGAVKRTSDGLTVFISGKLDETPKEKLENKLENPGMFMEKLERKDNITVNGTEWIVVVEIDSFEKEETCLYGSFGGKLVEDQDGVITVHVMKGTLNDIMPVLENLTSKRN